MADRIERIDGWLGRLLYRTLGLVLLLIAAATGYEAWVHATSDRPFGWTPAILFGLLALASASCVPHCLSRRRRLVEALDALESGTPDRPRRG